ncbi:TPA: hypothetical protein PX784_002452 [Vibrio cholerae]|nr:hypothetical protein [Vibrio cholerae]
MSYKHNYLAWQQHSNVNVEEKLVLLKLADTANSEGLTSFFLKDLTQDCLCEEFKLSSLLYSLAQKGLLAMGPVEREGKGERHTCRLTLTDRESIEDTTIPVLNTAQQSLPSSIQPIEKSNAPQWTTKTFDFYNIPRTSRNKIWQGFVQQHGRSNINISRLERDFENWLEHSKRNGNLALLIDSQTQASEDCVKQQGTHMSTSSNTNFGREFINTYDLNEDVIPYWAEKTLHHSALGEDLALFWQNYVLYQKTKPNFYGSVTQHINKLRYSINLKKQWANENKQKESAYQQVGGRNSRNLSPSEEFREFLREQGKKPSF